MEQGGFSATAGPHDGQELAGADFQVDPAQSGNLHLPDAEDHLEVLGHHQILVSIHFLSVPHSGEPPTEFK